MKRENKNADSVVDTLNPALYNGHNRMEGMSLAVVPDKLLTTQEVCELLKVSDNYIYGLTHLKKIPYIKMQGLLRFRRSDIDDWLRAQEVRSGS